MKSLWYRLKYSIQADLHEILDQKESKNPIAMLNHYIYEAEKQTTSIGKMLERQSTLHVELQKELSEAKGMIEKRRSQLDLAVKAGEEDLVDFVQDEIIAYETRATNLTDSIAETIKELIALERKFEEMKHKVKDMKVRQLQLMGKENVTHAHHQMAQIISPEKAERKLATLDEMNQYIENLSENVNHSYKFSSMEHRLELLETTGGKEKEIV